MWHASPAGVAYAASVQKPEGSCKPGKWCHPAETRSQRAWISTWQEIKQDSPAKELVAIYLSALSGTGTTDRWLGQVRKVEKFRAHMDPGGVEAAVKLLVQDWGGRRRAPLCPRSMLVRPVCRTTAGGGGVSHPISEFGLRAQKLYAALFGQCSLPSRQLVPLTPAEIARKRLLAERPRLSRGRKTCGGGEAELLRLREKSLQAGVARVLDGSSEGVGPLGSVELPAPKRRRLMADHAAGVNTMYSAIVTNSITNVPEIQDREPHALPAVQLQHKVIKKKAETFFHAIPGQPIPYVDAKAGLMRPEKPQPPGPGPPPQLPARPRVWALPEVGEACQIDRSQYAVRVSADCSKRCDIVVVPDIRLNFDAPIALAARLLGARLVDPHWFTCDREDKIDHEICFRSAVQYISHVIIHLHPSFVESHRKHATVLSECAALSPALSNGRPRFEVLCSSMPQSVAKPTLTYEVRGENYQHPEPEAGSASSARKSGKLWVLQDLLKFCTLVWDSREPSSSSKG